MKITGGNSLLDVKLIIMKSGLSEGMVVADLGCGSTGHFVFPAAETVGKTGRIYAVDIMKPVLESIKNRSRQRDFDNVYPVWSNLESFNATEIESSSLDMAFLVNTLYQSHKRVEIIKETVRMMKKGAKLVLVEWKNITLPFGPPVEERVKIDMLREAAPRLGLTVDEEFFAGQYHFGLIMIKN
jgi:ubiquinone/menaquinone biosynthesis C-methylase UbiE